MMELLQVDFSLTSKKRIYLAKLKLTLGSLYKSYVYIWVYTGYLAVLLLSLLFCVRNLPNLLETFTWARTSLYTWANTSKDIGFRSHKCGDGLKNIPSSHYILLLLLLFFWMVAVRLFANNEKTLISKYKSWNTSARAGLSYNSSVCRDFNHSQLEGMDIQMESAVNVSSIPLKENKSCVHHFLCVQSLKRNAYKGFW